MAAIEFEEMRESEKLRKKLSEMKHRLCLFEFGIGSIASLVQDADEIRKISTRSDRKTAASDNQKRVIEGIVKILEEVEKSLSAAEAAQGIEQEAFRQDQLPTAAGVPCLVEVNPNVVTTTVSPKARIFIDETETGGNSLTRSICNIQVVENSAIFSAGGNNAASSASHYADPALAALSTLAAVATNQMEARSVKNGMGNTDTNLSQRSREVGLEKHVNNSGNTNVPFKKRKLVDRNVKSFTFKRPRDVL
ncbi:hypothetical protein Ocin01_07088 [Orchesella cincta]|uniref:Uncharacterized protein n=1 Tax=Orchesella cincta TaxID=48709 RepID=A0A1D2N2Z8_ORCCI|nr:hypothetical protein Ocin01_07088 [Orchesella cincta]